MGVKVFLVRFITFFVAMMVVIKICENYIDNFFLELLVCAVAGASVHFLLKLFYIPYS